MMPVISLHDHRAVKSVTHLGAKVTVIVVQDWIIFRGVC